MGSTWILDVFFFKVGWICSVRERSQEKTAEMEKVTGGSEGDVNKLTFGHVNFDTLIRHPSRNIKQPV